MKFGTTSMLLYVVCMMLTCDKNLLKGAPMKPNLPCQLPENKNLG